MHHFILTKLATSGIKKLTADWTLKITINRDRNLDHFFKYQCMLEFLAFTHIFELEVKIQSFLELGLDAMCRRQ